VARAIARAFREVARSGETLNLQYIVVKKMSNSEEVYVRFSGQINENNMGTLMNVIQEELEKGVKNITIQMASWGGS